MSRLLAEPEAVEVAMVEGVPRWLRGEEGRQRVERVFARWRVESDWWRSPVSREYWKLALDIGEAPGLVCEVYQDKLTGAWWRSRIYD
ncbi:MAG: hypothetical protein WAT58_06910 [Candidatus Dormiibacterota bacterium]